MSTWLAVEDAVIAALKLVQVSGRPVLATVQGETCRDRKMLAAKIGRERLPAAYVVTSGRDAGDKDYRRAGEELLTIVYAVASGRGDAEARRGGTGVVGIFAAAGAAAAALQDAELPQNRRLVLLDERSIGGDEGTALWEQRYAVRLKSGLGHPLFGAADVTGAASEVDVEIGALERAATMFAFPGVDGTFERSIGSRERPILWRGQLRAPSSETLTSLEAGLETLVRTAKPDNLIDTWGNLFSNCVARRFTRKGVRRTDRLTGQIIQDFELEFAQLMV